MSSAATSRHALERAVLHEAMVWYRASGSFNLTQFEREHALWLACDALARLPARRTRYDEKRSGRRDE